MVSQFLRREKLNSSELLTNFLKLTQAWAGPLRDITEAPREAAAAAPACHACASSGGRGADGLLSRGAGLWLWEWLCGCWGSSTRKSQDGSSTSTTARRSEVPRTISVLRRGLPLCSEDLCLSFMGLDFGSENEVPTICFPQHVK